MTLCLTTSAEKVRTVEFSHNKYGTELLVDVAWIRDMPNFIQTDDPYRLDFYDITFISGGRGTFWLDGNQYRLKANTVFFTSPGQTRRWIVDGLEGLCLFFPEEFLLEHFNDPLFLHRLRYFHTFGSSHALNLSNKQHRRIAERLTLMGYEIQSLRDDSAHLLRAIAYEILITLNRWYVEKYGQQLENSANHTIAQYRRLIERDFRHIGRVTKYAEELGLTPGHLNHLCQKHLGQSAGHMIRQRIVSEARRLLVHSEYDVGQISTFLGYSDPSYFSRAFKRSTRLSPLHFRKRARRDLGI